MHAAHLREADAEGVIEMPDYRIPGSRNTSATASSRHKDDYLGVGLKPYLATQLDAARGQSESVATTGTKDDDVIKITLDGGIELWTSVGRAREDYGTLPAARGGEVLLVPRTLRFGRRERGVGEWIVKALDLFEVDVTGKIATEIVAALEAKFESRIGIRELGGAGLYRFGTDAKPREEKDIGKAMGGKPSLVFIHGTASCSEGGFGKMKDRKEWKDLFSLYDGRVFAFEHRTLSESPIQNAIQLAKALPDGAQIDLISHSRGGLVAELLCRSARVDETGSAIAAFDETDKSIYTKVRKENSPNLGQKTLQGELKLLDDLNTVLGKKKLKVRHLVRAGCPARGTTLASGRLDRYLSLIVSAMKLIPGFTTNPIFDLTMGLLLAVAKKRTNPDEVPGLEAQMPESPMIRMVNREDIILSSRLSVISGDVEGGGLFGRLKVLATDLFYLEDHDLVVNTSAMYGGAKRSAGAVAMFDKGTAVNHFSYFGNERTAKGILDALHMRLSPSDGFRPLEDFTRPPARARAALAARSGPAPVVYVLPGTMGSQLERDKRRVWFKLLQVAGGGIGKIKWNEPAVTPGGVFEDYYSDLATFLSASHEAIEFAYDWRSSLLAEGIRLADAVEKKLKETNQPIRFIAHSMGGLVVRAMAAQRPELWKRIMQNPGARFVMLGTPNMGSFSIVSTLLGRDKTIRQLEMLDFTRNMKDLLSIVSEYPGVLELLPRDKNAEIYDAAIWSRFRTLDGGKWAVPTAEALKSADRTWKAIEASALDSRGLAYVAGYSEDLTPTGFRFEQDKKVVLLGTRKGDGRVPWATGILPGVSVWYAEAAHGDLPRFKDKFPAYLELLITGQTSHLSSTPPAAARAAITEFEEIEERPIEIYPTEQDAMDAVMGAAPVRKREAVAKGRIKVRVVHGNLTFANHTVAVGHYDGDTIRGAEKTLDRLFDGRLSRKRKLGLYPGKLETAALIRDEDGKPPGALIVGLGRFGELSPGALRRTYGHAVKMYSDIYNDDGRNKKPVSVSTLLIGHRESRLTLRDSISALMHGLIDAKEELQGFTEIEELEIVEIYQDTAIAAMRVLRELKVETRMKDHLEIAEKLATRNGKLRRIAPIEETGWARKIDIRRKEDGPNRGSLTFTALTGSARAIEVSLATQSTLIDPYIRSLTGTTAIEREVSRTLFELLTPKEFKSAAAEDRDVVLILDEAAAAFPWELLDDRLGSGEEPMVVRSSCIRQLIHAQPEFQSGLSAARLAVVIGDSDNSESGEFQSLPGAQEEAKAITALLKQSGQDIDVKDVIKGNCAAITEALLLTGARIMHIAAHGVYEYERDNGSGDKDKVTGMVLGNGAFFTAQEVNQIRPFPELVFLNCCYLGKSGPQKDENLKRWNDRHLLASNLAHQFIRNGAKVVVAAGWAVDDEAAKTFATEFYSSMLAGFTFSEAVKAARKATYDLHRGCNTWGAYQCYGDPDYILTDTGRTAQWKEQGFLSDAEAEIELDNISENASTASVGKLDDFRTAIDALAQRIDTPWLAKSGIQERLAKAYANAEQFDKAIEAYGAAVAGKDAGASLKAIEQMANIRARQAVLQLRASGGSVTPKQRRQAKSGIAIAIRQLNELNGLIKRSSKNDVETVERLTMLASAMKGLGAIATGPERVKALREAADMYEKAFEIATLPDRELTNAYYPAINALVLRGLENLLGKKAAMGEKQHTMLNAIRENALSQDRDSPDFFTLASKTDALVAECIWTGRIAERADDIVKSFQLAWKRGGTHLQRNSVLEQLNFIAECLSGVRSASGEVYSDSVRHIHERIKLASSE
jgi:CHAT domain-containing protein/pimeloyl-ACP methyl ester carboxylesterase